MPICPGIPPSQQFHHHRNGDPPAHGRSGGIGNIWGGVIGAIVVTVIYDQTKDYYFYQPLIFGIIMVVMVVFMPHGIGGVVKQAMIKRKFIENQEESRGSA